MNWSIGEQVAVLEERKNLGKSFHYFKDEIMKIQGDQIELKSGLIFNDELKSEYTSNTGTHLTFSLKKLTPILEKKIKLAPLSKLIDLILTGGNI